MKKILVYGYGNPGRSDDGLGNEFVSAIDNWCKENNIHNITTDSNYQLNIEDASAISNYDTVVFVDASKADIESFHLNTITPEVKETFTTHSLSPETLVALCVELYHSTPRVYLLQIKGYNWDLGEGISEKAKKNLEHSLLYFQTTMINQL